MDGPVAIIHDSAVRTPSPVPRVEGFLSGHERRGVDDRCWRPHGTADWLLLHTLSGQARVVLPGRAISVRSGETVLYRPGAPQEFGSDSEAEPWELVWMHFEPLHHWLELVSWPEVSPGVLSMSATEPFLRERVGRLLLEADRLSASGLPRATRLALNVLEAAFLWWDIHNRAHSALDARVVEAIELVSRDPRRRISVDELARAVHLSPSRFAHLFKQETGVTPRRFAEQRRIERAKQLLELTSLPVNAIARDTGFASPFYFATRFRTLTGTTPSAFRSARCRTRPAP